MTNYISGKKIDSVAAILLTSYTEKTAKLKKQMEEALTEECKKFLPNEVLDFFKIYPNKVHVHGNVSFYSGSKYYYLTVKLPTLEMDVNSRIIKKGTDIFNTLTKLAEESEANEREYIITRNQIKCTLSKLRTYKQIQLNFPEAYDILVYKVDKVTESLCDNVEELRAKLNKEIPK